MKVLFSYIAQLHQVLHSLPIAAELAMRHPHITVCAAGASAGHVAFIRRLLAEHAPHAPVRVEQLRGVLLNRVRYKRKRRLLLRNLPYFRSFDAIVTPERTSLFLRRTALGRTRLIWSGHGAGDRAIGFADDIHQFDYVLMAGRKIESRLLAAGQVRPGQYTTGVYPKFDWMPEERVAGLFGNDRPVVLYTPHFRSEFSSWPTMGRAVLEFFAANPQWNVIFAPHVRLFLKATNETRAALAAYGKLPNMHVDLGSERSVDMTYTNAADVYLGDVSSQVAEFVHPPRPCLFLNAHRVSWRGDPNYLFWNLGPVVEDLDDLNGALARAVKTHAHYVSAQREYVRETFGLAQDQPSAGIGADAIATYLEHELERRRAARWWLPRATARSTTAHRTGVHVNVANTR